MKVGDLVRNLYPRCRHEIGIIIDVDAISGDVYTVVWMHGEIEYMNSADIAVISEVSNGD
ncbi:hypothetical protein CMI47_14375 [Candidatus Pacearchaeota archaeon]|nr:hypothetical protein [Candidatus Pacearchaeota archaeon]